jgi:hypothetical protein
LDQFQAFFSNLLKRAGPSTASEILAGIGEIETTWGRSNLACSINAYMRRKQFFIRCDGNKFGLLEHARPVAPKEPSSLHSIKNRARQRLIRRLDSGQGVITPAGIVYARPSNRQWCGQQGDPHLRKNADIEAHHYLGYGTPVLDITVIFARRSCRHYFDSRKDSTSVIVERFPTQKRADP